MLHPQSRGLIFLLGALTGLTALSIDMSLPVMPTLQAVFAATADQASLTLSMILAGFGEPAALWRGDGAGAAHGRFRRIADR